MPGNIINADTGFPQFEQGESAERRIAQIMNYLSILSEQLRYVLENLSVENFNEKDLADFSGKLTGPVREQIDALGERVGQVGQMASMVGWLIGSGTGAGDFTLTERAKQQAQVGLRLGAEKIDLTEDHPLAVKHDGYTNAVISDSSIDLRYESAPGGGETFCPIQYSVKDADGDYVKAASIYLGDYGALADGRYALIIDAGTFVDNHRERRYVSLELDSMGSMFLDATGAEDGNGVIQLMPADVVILKPQKSFDEAMEFYSNRGYLFCTDGIYHNGVRLVEEGD